MKKTNCRLCKSEKLKVFLDMGFTPLADAFLTKEQLNEPEKYYPLRVCVCLECGLAQLDYLAPPEEMYKKNYPYLSSITKTGKKHFHGMAESISKRFKLGSNDFAMDIGSNIGVLLEGFRKQGLDVLGIDPAANIAKRAIHGGIETWPEYFGSHLTKKILEKKGKASVITGTNVFAHIDDIDDMVSTVKDLLKEDGLFIIEVPYLVDLIKNLEYDTMYHEHLSYISIKPLVMYFEKFGMEIFDVEKYPIHGGTIRIFIANKVKQKISNNVKKFLNLEDEEKIHSLERLKKFEEAVKKQKEELIDLLRDLKKKGKKIVGLSAPAKGNTLLNYCGIGKNYLDYLTEKTDIKIGLYSPGTHIKIVEDKKLLEDAPDYALLLAWNFKDEIIKNLQAYKKKGGKFIIPIPSPKIY